MKIPWLQKKEKRNNVLPLGVITALDFFDMKDEYPTTQRSRDTCAFLMKRREQLKGEKAREIQKLESDLAIFESLTAKDELILEMKGL